MTSQQTGRDYLKSGDWDVWRDRPTDQKNGVPCPPLHKPATPGAKIVDLVPTDQISVGRMPLLDVLRKRRSRRKYTPQPLTLEELSYLLWSTQGIDKVIEDCGPLSIFRETLRRLFWLLESLLGGWNPVLGPVTSPTRNWHMFTNDARDVLARDGLCEEIFENRENAVNLLSSFELGKQRDLVVVYDEDQNLVLESIQILKDRLEQGEIPF